MATVGRKPSIEELQLHSFKLPKHTMAKFKKHAGKYQTTKVLIGLIKKWLEEKEVPCKVK